MKWWSRCRETKSPEAPASRSLSSEYPGATKIGVRAKKGTKVLDASTLIDVKPGIQDCKLVAVCYCNPVACSRGKANPSDFSKTKLFAASAGYCGRPECERELFRDVDGAEFHLAEIAHIIAAGDKGPRPDKTLSAAERGAFENLILLCVLCHTEI